MSDQERPVSEEELHAFVDGQLRPGDVARIERWLEQHPESAEKVAQWQRQNSELKGMFAPYRRALPGDAELLRERAVRQPLVSQRPARQHGQALMRSGLAAAGICLFAAGATVGHFLPATRAPVVQEASLQDEASSAFLIYASEVRHPVEVRADERDHLVNWLGKRLGHKFVAPDLAGFGFQLVGGRLVPVNGKAGALLMYEEASGKRLTVLVGQSEAEAITSFRFASRGPVETFYWIDDTLSYAVTGEIPRDTLRQIADICYQQFDV